jgi:hypothetical protein
MRVDRTAPNPPASSREGRPRASTQRTFLEILREGQPQQAPPPVPAATPPPSPTVHAIAQIVQRVNTGEARVDALLDAAARGKTFTPGELIALQATVFRYSQTVEVLSRVTDKLVGAVKQTLGTQV